MKKIIAILISVLMLASLFSMTVIPASAAAVEGEWIPIKVANVSDDAQWPVAGYEYTSEGFVSISPDYTNYTVRQCVVTREAYKLDINNDENGHVLSLEFTVEDFAYTGQAGNADEWIAIALWNEQQVNQESDSTGLGYHTLIRGAGEGSANVGNYIVNNGCGRASEVAINPEVNGDGKEVYSFVLDRDASGAYTLTICGVDMGYLLKDEYDLDDTLTELNKTGAYLSISFHSTCTEEGAGASVKITNFNGHTPYGDDSAAPEENHRNFAELADSSTVPANQPAVIWDSTMKDTGSLGGSNMTCTINPDGTVHCAQITSTTPWIMWNVKSESSYKAEDFPYVAMLSKNLNSNITLFYFAGENLAAGTDVLQGVATDDYEFYDGWQLGIFDLDLLWEGRINGMRVDVNSFDIYQDDPAFEVAFVGCFRSEDEAVAYTQEYMDKLYAGEDTAEVTTEAQEVTTAKTPEETTAKTEVTTAAQAESTTALADETTKAEEKSGCGGMIAGFPIIAVAVLGIVSVKKKD